MLYQVRKIAVFRGLFEMGFRDMLGVIGRPIVITASTTWVMYSNVASICRQFYFLIMPSILWRTPVLSVANRPPNMMPSPLYFAVGVVLCGFKYIPPSSKYSILWPNSSVCLQKKWFLSPCVAANFILAFLWRLSFPRVASHGCPWDLQVSGNCTLGWATFVKVQNSLPFFLQFFLSTFARFQRKRHCFRGVLLQCPQAWHQLTQQT